MKQFIFMALAHVLMPLICTACALFLIVYWGHMFQYSIDAMWFESLKKIFWIVFLLVHFKFAIDWWFVRDL